MANVHCFILPNGKMISTSSNDLYIGNTSGNLIHIIDKNGVSIPYTSKTTHTESLTVNSEYSGSSWGSAYGSWDTYKSKHWNVEMSINIQSVYVEINSISISANIEECSVSSLGLQAQVNLPSSQQNGASNRLNTSITATTFPKTYTNTNTDTINTFGFYVYPYCISFIPAYYNGIYCQYNRNMDGLPIDLQIQYLKKSNNLYVTGEVIATCTYTVYLNVA